MYHTTDSYLVGTVLNAFWRSKKGPAAEYYQDLLADGLWPALGLSPVLAVPRRTYDRTRQPFTGYGLTLHRDDIVKIAMFLEEADGRIGNSQMLDRGLLEAALQRDPERRGLQAGGADIRYNLGLWAWNAQHVLGCGSPTWIPFMSGYGGIVVAMPPNGMIYYYVSDGGVFRWALAAAEMNRIRPFCKE